MKVELCDILCKSVWRGFECELTNGHPGRHYHDDIDLNGDLWWSDDNARGLCDGENGMRSYGVEPR